MRAIHVALCLMLVIPLHAYAAKLTVTVPQGVTEVKLLSGGTASVLGHYRGRLDADLKAAGERYQIGRCEAEVKKASQAVTDADKAYTDKIDQLRRQYIAKINVTVHSATAQITSASALGEISFVFTAANTSERIVSDIIYKPVIQGVPLPITTSLVLEFVNPKNLIFGLAPGESITNQDSDPEHFTFFLSELTESDKKRIQTSLPGGFSVEILDLHFVSQKGYKGQSKVMDVKEAFAGVLSAYEGAVRTARNAQAAATETLEKAKKLYASETSGSLAAFRTRSKDLRKASVRFSAPVDIKKSRATMDDVPPGTYYVYGSTPAGQALFEEVAIMRGRNKVTIESLKKDPFEP